jgi:tRNA 2-thiouridine synthesizing protein A
MTQEIAEVDARGLSCPLPLLKAKQALNRLAAGERLRVVATDAGSVRDFRVFCEQSGNRLIEASENGGVYTYLLQKRGA